MTRATKNNNFEDLLASYMNTLRFVRYRFDNLSLALARKTNALSTSLYLCIPGALVRKGGMVQLDVYSGKLAILPTGQRGDPLNFFMYGVLLDIATKNGTADLCEYLSLLVSVSSAISVKSIQMPILCT